ncbi:MAG: hypothetical protein ACRD2Z_18850 [Thermoanaerobaculia bacterium]
MTRETSGRAKWWIGLLALAVWQGDPGEAAQVRFLELVAREEFAAGTLDGVAVGPLGSLSLADRSERVAGVDEPFLFSAARHPQGWVLGTGNEGKVLLATRQGEVEELFDAPEPEVFAVWADPDGTIFAATSPRGKVYRLAGGEAEEYFDPGETYIWALARAADGALLVATGTEGRLYRVTGRGEGEVVFDSDDPHVRSLLALADGRVLLGTHGEGQIVELTGERARTLYDAEQPEVVALAEGPDGVVYAAVIASEASVVDAARAAGAVPRTQQPQAQEPQRQEQEEPDEPGEGQEEEPGSAEGSVVVSAGTATVTATEQLKGPRSAILRLERNGFAHEVEALNTQTVYSLLWARDRLWIGTGAEGQLFSWRDGHRVLEKDVDERQVVALVADDPGPAFATTNAAALYRVTAVSERQGEYTSAALDARQASRFGELRWEGDVPAGASLAFSARSGMSSEPDATWSAWSTPREGNGVPLAAIPPGRYVQWRARLRAADGRSPEIRRVTVSYRHENLPPRIREMQVLEPGVSLLYPGSAGRDEVFEAWRPERDSIFSGLRGASGDEDRPRRGRRPGFRSLVWSAEDPNGDELSFRLSFWPEAEGSEWLVMAEELDDPWFSFDSTALPDGWYRVRLQARDRPREANDGDATLKAEQISVPMLIDNTAPTLGAARRDGDVLEVEVEDALSPLRAVRVSVDAQRWEPAEAEDGLVDGLHETLRLPIPDAGTLLLLQVEDAAGNLTTFDLSRWLP